MHLILVLFQFCYGLRRLCWCKVMATQVKLWTMEEDSSVPQYYNKS